MKSPFSFEPLSKADLSAITATTLHHYEANAASFWEGTKDHDVSQNRGALLAALPQRTGLKILDFGCGPGRDLIYFKSIGHQPTGLDGAKAFCEMAEKNSGCPVLYQNFLSLELGAGVFDGIFANASLFHVPRQEIVRVLKDLRRALVDGGILFSSNPRGNDEGWSGQRYGTYFELESYRECLTEAGFEMLHHFFRPSGLPIEQQPWLATVSLKTDYTDNNK